ncbi:MAG: hypothetical protein CSA68_05840 [Rhodobacterales bacterium]|nr:MAG: hypothetical protein CSA68_05840 [Rhodobacterales bacterium]
MIAATIYMLMIGVTLAHIQALSGHVPFDMRPLGYRYADAAALLEALGEEGRIYYLSRQIPLDTLYPAMLALALVTTIFWFGQRIPHSRLVHLGIVFSVGSALFDYAENVGIAVLIWSWPEVSVPLVYAASAATLVKSALTTLAILLTIFIGFLWARFRHS